MGWVKLDDAYTHHPKVVAAGVQAMALDVGGMCYSAAHLTDGFIPDAAVPMLAPIRNANAAAAALVKVGRWERDEQRKGFVVHDYLVYNPAAEKVLAEREENRRRVEAHRKGGRKPPGKPVGNGVTTHVGNGVSTEAPSPSSGSSKSSSEEPLGGEPSDDDDRIGITATTVTDRLQARLDVRNSRKWRPTTLADQRRQAAEWFAEHPAGTVGDAVAALDPGGEPQPPKPADQLERSAQAQMERAERGNRQVAGEVCEECSDTGLVLDDSGTARACSCPAGKLVRT